MNKIKKAFALIELVAILVIISVLSIIAVPIFFSTSTYQALTYHDELLNSIRYARKLAVATGGHFEVSLTSTSLTLQQRIEGSSCSNGTTFQAVVDPSNNSSGYVKNAPGSITLSSSSQWPIYFDGLGRANQASTCSTLSSNATITIGSKTITVVGETGFAQ